MLYQVSSIHNLASLIPLAKIFGGNSIKSTFCRTFAPMFDRLKQKWKVNGWQLAIILVVFALGGSLCGWLGRKVLGLFDIEQTAIRIPLYILLVTLLWPMCVIIISIPFGQFPFFRNYLKKIFRRMSGGKANVKSKM